MGLWSRTYCCCAVPLYNLGIYAILAQFAVVSLVTGILSLAAPKIVSVAIPSFGSYILGACCIVVAGTQLLGFLGVYRERPSLYRHYARWNTISIVVALAVALAFIVLSCVRHSTALKNCEALFALESSNVAQNSTVCNIWMWVQVGLMGLLWIVVAIVEIYFMTFSHIYGSEQKLDHAKYESVYETVREEIRQSGIYDSQGTGLAGRPYSSSSEEPFATPPHPTTGQHARHYSGLRHEMAYADDEIEVEDDKMMAGSHAYVQPSTNAPYDSSYLHSYSDPYADGYGGGGGGGGGHGGYGGYAGRGYAASEVSGYQDASLPRNRHGPNVLQSSSRRY